MTTAGWFLLVSIVGSILGFLGFCYYHFLKDD
jgi:hypothetical protein